MSTPVIPVITSNDVVTKLLTGYQEKVNQESLREKLNKLPLKGVQWLYNAQKIILNSKQDELLAILGGDVLARQFTISPIQKLIFKVIENNDNPAALAKELSKIVTRALARDTLKKIAFSSDLNDDGLGKIKAAINQYRTTNGNQKLTPAELRTMAKIAIDLNTESSKDPKVKACLVRRAAAIIAAVENDPKITSVEVNSVAKIIDKLAECSIKLPRAVRNKNLFGENDPNSEQQELAVTIAQKLVKLPITTGVLWSGKRIDALKRIEALDFSGSDEAKAIITLLEKKSATRVFDVDDDRQPLREVVTNLCERTGNKIVTLKFAEGKIAQLRQLSAKEIAKKRETYSFVGLEQKDYAVVEIKNEEGEVIKSYDLQNDADIRLNSRLPVLDKSEHKQIEREIRRQNYSNNMFDQMLDQVGSRATGANLYAAAFRSCLTNKKFILGAIDKDLSASSVMAQHSKDDPTAHKLIGLTYEEKDSEDKLTTHGLLINSAGDLYLYTKSASDEKTLKPEANWDENDLVWMMSKLQINTVAFRNFVTPPVETATTATPSRNGDADAAIVTSGAAQVQRPSPSPKVVSIEPITDPTQRAEKINRIMRLNVNGAGRHLKSRGVDITLAQAELIIRCAKEEGGFSEIYKKMKEGDEVAAADAKRLEDAVNEGNVADSTKITFKEMVEFSAFFQKFTGTRIASLNNSDALQVTAALKRIVTEEKKSATKKASPDI